MSDLSSADLMQILNLTQTRNPKGKELNERALRASVRLIWRELHMHREGIFNVLKMFDQWNYLLN